MRARLFLLFIVSIVMASCQFIDQQVPSKDELLEKELKSINWEEVDEFPSIALCDSVQDKAQRKQCFFDFLMQNIQQRLEVDTLTMRYGGLDTIRVKVTVFPDSSVKFQTRITDSAGFALRAADSILQLKLNDFPKISPALKRGLPVKTQFELPVILNVEKARKRR